MALLPGMYEAPGSISSATQVEKRLQSLCVEGIGSSVVKSMQTCTVFCHQHHKNWGGGVRKPLQFFMVKLSGLSFATHKT